MPDATVTSALIAALVSLGGVLLSKSKCVANLDERGPFESLRIGFLDAPLEQGEIQFQGPPQTYPYYSPEPRYHAPPTREQVENIRAAARSSKPTAVVFAPSPPRLSQGKFATTRF